MSDNVNFSNNSGGNSGSGGGGSNKKGGFNVKGGLSNMVHLYAKITYQVMKWLGSIIWGFIVGPIMIIPAIIGLLITIYFLIIDGVLKQIANSSFLIGSAMGKLNPLKYVFLGGSSTIFSIAFCAGVDISSASAIIQTIG